MKSFIKFVIIIIFGILINSCGNKDGKIPGDIVKNPRTADGAAVSGDLPKFEFETMEHDFGDITEGSKVSYTFKFKNTGNASLVITQVKAACGCTTPKYPRYPIKPGESEEVNVTFDSRGKHDMQSKTVTILANTDPPTTVLTIKANVKK